MAIYSRSSVQNFDSWWLLDKQKWTKQITKKYFNKILIMTIEDEEIYNNSQICWICKEKLNTDKEKQIHYLI